MTWPGILAVTLALLPGACLSWGNLGHRTVALVAEKHLTPWAKLYARHLLGSTDLSDMSTWADFYKTLPEGRHTASWHFVDAHDSPPDRCNVDVHRLFALKTLYTRRYCQDGMIPLLRPAFHYFGL